MAAPADVLQQIIDYPTKHLCVLGLPGSGKTSALIRRYRALVASGVGPVFIVTYSRDQLRQITRDVLPNGAAQAGPLPVLTYFNLGMEILEAAGRAPRIIDGMAEDLLVRRIVRAASDSLDSDFRAICSSETFQREIVGLFHLFQQNRVEGERLDRVRQRAKRSPRIGDVLRLYDDYTKALASRGLATYFTVSWRAADAVSALPDTHALRRAAVYLVDDFQDVDAGQFALLSRLVPPAGGGPVLNVFGDPMGAYFGFRGTDPRFLMDELPVLYECDVVRLGHAPGAPLGPALHALAGAVLGDQVTGGFVGDLAVGVGVPGGRGATGGEGNAVGDGGTAEGRVGDGGGASDHAGDGGATALSGKDLSDLGPLFAAARGTDAGASGSRSSGSALSMEAVVECVGDEVEECYGVARRARDLIEAGDYRPCDIAVITNDKSRYEPLLRSAFAQHGVSLDTGRPVQSGFRGFVHALLSLLEVPRDAVALQSLTTSPFYAFFRAQVLGAQAPEFRDPLLEGDVMREFMSTTRRRMRDEAPARWMRWLVDECLVTAARAYGEATNDESVFGFLSLLLGRWDEFVDAAGETGEPVDLPTFARVSRLFDMPSTGPMPTLDEVGFFSCREAHGRFFPVVFVMGCAELLFPSPLRRETIVSAPALQSIVDAALGGEAFRVYGARTPDAHLAEEFHLMFSSFTRATARLYVSAPRSFAGQRRPAPASIFEGTVVERDSEPARLEGKIPPPIRLANAWVGRSATAGLEGRVGELSRVAGVWNTPAPAPAEFAVERFSLSKSSLESFLTCPRQFFYLKILRIKEDESGALQLGKIYHDVMAKLNEASSSKADLHKRATDAFVARAIEDAMAAGQLPADTFFGRSLRFHVHAMVSRTLDYDRRNGEDYAIEAAETRFDYESGGFDFNGRADRIERGAGGLSLMDYKTGQFRKKGETLRARVLDCVEQPERGNWQVPLYVQGCAEDRGEIPDTFQHLVQQPGEEPFMVTLFVRPDDADVPPFAMSTKRVHQGYSYLLVPELDAIMARAADHAAAIFAPRTGFGRTEDLGPCRRCMFSRVCDRRVD